MVFIISQNRHPFLWLRWLLPLLIVLIFGGRFFIMRGIIIASKSFPSAHNVALSSSERSAFQAKIADLEAERNHLYALLQNKDPLKKILFANVQLGGGYIFSDSLIIDKGVSDDVAVGDFVTTDDGLLVGSVIDRGPHWSAVASFTQLGRKVVVRGGGSKQIVFEMNGIGGGEAEVDLPISLDIKVGDVYWSGEHSDYIVGVVDHIDRSPTSQIQTVYMKPPISLIFLTRVVIHTKV